MTDDTLFGFWSSLRSQCVDSVSDSKANRAGFVATCLESVSTFPGAPSSHLIPTCESTRYL